MVKVFEPVSTRVEFPSRVLCYDRRWVCQSILQSVHSVFGHIVSGWTTAEITHPLPSNGRPLLLFTRSNLFTESLLSNGYGADPHTKHYLQHLFCCCVTILRPLRSNGSTLLLVSYLLRACLPSPWLAIGTCVTTCTSNLLLPLDFVMF
jgi:hypothetical protein